MQGRLQQGSLQRDAVAVDAVVSTVGFPLVGGPAGTMEAGRQADVAKAILSAKNVPYIVAAPLLIQVRPHVAAYCYVGPLFPQGLAAPCLTFE